MEKDGRKKNIFAPDILVVIRGQKTYNGARKQEEKTTMLKFGMPTLIEIPEPEQCAALCRKLELSFVEMNMNLPQYQVQTMGVSRLKGIAKEYGIGYGAINHPVDRDPVCGYNGIIGDVCPRCGRRDGEGVPLEKLQKLGLYKHLNASTLGQCGNPDEEADRIPNPLV